MYEYGLCSYLVLDKIMRRFSNFIFFSIFYQAKTSTMMIDILCWSFFLQLVAMLDEDEEDRVDETALQQLTEMGFPESRAIKALRLNQ